MLSFSRTQILYILKCSQIRQMFDKIEDNSPKTKLSTQSAMDIHKDFPKDPFVILDPAMRWFPADEDLRGQGQRRQAFATAGF